MSEANVETVRAMFEFFLTSQQGAAFEPFYAAIERGPTARDIEWDARDAERLGLGDIAAVYRGREGVLGFWREWLSAWEAVEFDYELVDAGEQVVALIDQTMRGRSSHLEVALGKYAHVFTFREGLITRWKLYADQAEALKAAGVD